MDNNYFDTNSGKDGAKVATLGCGVMFFVIAMLVAMLMWLTGCKTIETTREVPVITEHTTVQHHTDIIRDTLFMRDSVYHYVQGDTVLIEKWHQAISINKTFVTDTVRDTIPKIVTVTEIRTKEVNVIRWWQHALMSIGAIMLVTGILAFLKRFL